MKHLLLAAILFILPAQAQSTSETTTEPIANKTTQIHTSYTMVEKAVRKAAVKVATDRGHGSGTLVRYKDMALVITAHHVANGSLGQDYLILTESEQLMGVLIYTDPLNDIAVIYPVGEFKYAKPKRSLNPILRNWLKC